MQFRHGPFDILWIGGGGGEGGFWDFYPSKLFFSHALRTRIVFLIYFIQEHFIGNILFFNKLFS